MLILSRITVLLVRVLLIGGMLLVHSGVLLWCSPKKARQRQNTLLSTSAPQQIMSLLSLAFSVAGMIDHDHDVARFSSVRAALSGQKQDSGVSCFSL